MLFVAAAVWGAQDARTWHWKHFSGPPQGRFVLPNDATVDAKIDVLIVEDMAFDGIDIPSNGIQCIDIYMV